MEHFTRVGNTERFRPFLIQASRHVSVFTTVVCTAGFTCPSLSDSGWSMCCCRATRYMRQFEKFQLADLDSYFEEAYARAPEDFF